MDFLILGSLEAESGGRCVPLGGRCEQNVLAKLVLNAGRVVPVRQLVDAVWDGDPPTTSGKQVRNAISRLRRTLGGAGAGDLIVTGGAGYRLAADGRTVDAQVFEAQVAAAGQAASEGRVAEAAGRLRSALALWRGPALAGLTGRDIESSAAAWDERRFAVQELYYGHELALERHREVLGELAGLAASTPFRENLVGQYMMALCRCGRQADALAVYRGTRELLAEQMGLDPGPDLQRLQQQILTADRGSSPRDAGRPAQSVPRQLPGRAEYLAGRKAQLAELSTFPDRASGHSQCLNGAPSSAAGPVSGTDVAPAGVLGAPAAGTVALLPAIRGVPQVRYSLPADTAAFTGRGGELEQITAGIAGATAAGGVVAVGAIDGMPGVGKTALAVHIARVLAEEFPDRQLFIDLHAHTPGHQPVEAEEALAGLLAATGVDPRHLPGDLDGRAAMWRDRMAGQRAVLVLDNAAGRRLPGARDQPPASGRPARRGHLCAAGRAAAQGGSGDVHLAGPPCRG
jgi:DNA-binding SARP family transcriptional activator